MPSALFLVEGTRGRIPVERRVGQTIMIDSPSNSTVRMLRELHEAAGRREHGAFLLEGTRLVSEAASASWSIVAALYDVEKAARDGALADLVATLPGAQPASARAIKHASDTVTPQGIVAAARLPQPAGAIDTGEPLVLVLDGVSDPGNAGTLLRSAAAAGVLTVLTVRGTVDLFAPKVVRGGMGAHFRLRLGWGLSWDTIKKRLGEGRSLVVAQGDAGPPYYSFDWRMPSALVIGSEAHGPAPEARRVADAMVAIPLEANVESLNAAIAGSLILFEAKRQRDTSPTA